MIGKRGCAILVIALLLAGCGPRLAPPSDIPISTGSIREQESTRFPGSGKSTGDIPIIRVGIVPEVSSATISSRGAWRVSVVEQERASETVPGGATWTCSASQGLLNVTDHSGTTRSIGTDTLFAYPAGSSRHPLEVGNRSYRGEMLVFASDAGRVTVVNVLDLESYLRGVVPAEIGAAGPDRIEAVKAQTVAARSYTLAYLNRWRKRGFDLLSTNADQVYDGIGGERSDVDNALRQTCGVVAMHDGRPIEAFYSSTCGGTTAEPDEVWGRPGRDYLKARRDRRHKGDDYFCVRSPFHRWTETWSGTDLERILKGTLPSATGVANPASWGRLTDLKLKKKSKSRRTEKLEVVFQKKTFTIGGDEIRWIIKRSGGGGLRSALLIDVDVDRSKGRVSKVRIKGAGFGHGVGLCQYGALGMARAGYDYKQILRFYYKGIRLVRAYDQWPG